MPLTYLYRLSSGAVHAHNPSVSDRKQARGGVKTISLTYYQNEVRQLHSMGLDCHSLREGLEPKYSAHLDILAPRLSLVANA